MKLTLDSSSYSSNTTRHSTSLFFVNSIKNLSRNFNILHYLHFTKGNTRSSSHSKLVQSSTPTNTGSHFYFIRFPRLWNSLPPLDLTLSVNTLKNTIINFFWSNFSANSDSSNPCSYHYLCPCSKCSSTPSPPISTTSNIGLH